MAIQLLHSMVCNLGRFQYCVWFHRDRMSVASISFNLGGGGRLDQMIDEWPTGFATHSTLNVYVLHVACGSSMLHGFRSKCSRTMLLCLFHGC